MAAWTGLWKWDVLGPDLTCTCQLSSRGCLQLWLLWPSGRCSSKRIWRQNSSLVEIYDRDLDRNSWCRKVKGPRRGAKDVKKEKWMTGWKNVWKKWMITCFWLWIHTHTLSLFTHTEITTSDVHQTWHPLQIYLLNSKWDKSFPWPSQTSAWVKLCGGILREMRTHTHTHEQQHHLKDMIWYPQQWYKTLMKTTAQVTVVIIMIKQYLMINIGNNFIIWCN